MVKFIALSGFLGAGKTTTMIAAAEQLRAAGRRVVVIANDQGLNLVDTAMAGRNISGAGEVTTGCFCCRFDDLVSVARRLVDQEGADTVIAESVGSCTDLTATVVRPLRQFYGDEFQLAPLTTLVDPVRYARFEAGWVRGEPDTDLAYLYRKQLQDGDIIAVNKLDLLDPSARNRVVEDIQRRFPHVRVVTCAAARGELQELRRAWDSDYTEHGRDLDIDYIRYGVAEARLAWLNRTYDLAGRDRGFTAARWVDALLGHIAATCQRNGYVIGHVKVMVTNPAGAVVKASVVDEAEKVTFDERADVGVDGLRATLNARVLCEPPDLDLAVDGAVVAADAESGSRTVAEDTLSFKPGQPKPTHRLRSPEPIH
ncbi:GTP-binding protein [Amycolatopsis sp. NPDC051071]|uniref:GTP-binding protein n=1 Tax=Amycolatopsis sp. NPDC051071 TaxID=3154637 RepID=UPI00342B6C69